jgi:hypothetical protein
MNPDDNISTLPARRSLGNLADVRPVIAVDSRIAPKAVLATLEVLEAHRHRARARDLP